MLHSDRVQVESALLFETVEEIYARVFRALRPASPVPEVRVEFRRYASANSFIRLEAGRLSVRISDLLEGAPAPVAEALAFILVCKLFRKPVPRVYSHRYRLYLNRREMRRALHLVRRTRGRKRLCGPSGICHNLEELFEELNTKYFHGLLARPSLSWSRCPSRSTLGHFDSSHNAILISRLFDADRVPRLALEYVLFHEMLHLRYPVEHNGSRRRIHTKEFRQAEKSFEGLREAKEILKKLCASGKID